MSQALDAALRSLDFAALVVEDSAPRLRPEAEASWRRAYFQAFRLMEPGEEYHLGLDAYTRLADRIEVRTTTNLKPRRIA